MTDKTDPHPPAVAPQPYTADECDTIAAYAAQDSSALVAPTFADFQRLFATLASLLADKRAGGERVSDDTACIPPFMTVRACRHCGVLTVGGPTACMRCAVRGWEPSPEATPHPAPDESEVPSGYGVRQRQPSVSARRFEATAGRRVIGCYPSEAEAIAACHAHKRAQEAPPAEAGAVQVGDVWRWADSTHARDHRIGSIIGRNVFDEDADTSLDAALSLNPDGTSAYPGCVWTLVSRTPAQPAERGEARAQCKLTMPRDASGHWRDWHRGHGCAQDPEPAHAHDVWRHDIDPKPGTGLIVDECECGAQRTSDYTGMVGEGGEPKVSAWELPREQAEGDAKIRAMVERWSADLESAKVKALTARAKLAEGERDTLAHEVERMQDAIDLYKLDIAERAEERDTAARDLAAATEREGRLREELRSRNFAERVAASVGKAQGPRCSIENYSDFVTDLCAAIAESVDLLASPPGGGADEGGAT